MTASIDPTCDPGLRSWVASANAPGADFPIQNLPLGVFLQRDADPEIGVAIGDQVLSLRVCAENDLLPEEFVHVCQETNLNALLALGRGAGRRLRRRISELLREGSPELAQREDLVSQALVEQRAVRMDLPVEIYDYTDFYASIHHATNVGSMFRPDNPLLPNYKYIPVGYHGRASSVAVSGSRVRRPLGQTISDDASAPTYGPSRLLDYELEVGFYVGQGTPPGSIVGIDEAETHVFGLCLVNDWSARDVQKWGYQPLGPFLSKSFKTTVSPWVVMLDALEPFRLPAFERPAGDPSPLPHLDSRQNRERGGIDLTLEVHLSSARMRDEGKPPVRLSRGSFRNMYWTIAQMLTHHASNGCNLRTGDLMASGTVSGPDKSERGCLLELTWRGSEPLELPTGEQRKFLADGDEVILRGYCEREGFVRIGLGECRGVIMPARERA
jgi:fumarylacetoacetase